MTQYDCYPAEVSDGAWNNGVLSGPPPPVKAGMLPYDVKSVGAT